MTIGGRILAHQSLSGTANMALDEALLEEVAADPSFAYIRTYEWLVPTLSLGYFQKLEEAEADPRFGQAPIVRRATGGGAIWHDREITYSAIIPAHHPLARQAQVFYRVIHEAVGRIIAARGLEVSRRGESAPSSEAEEAEKRSARGARPLLCFTDRDPEDLVSNGVKIVGSAQRRRAGAVLQHGSILLAGSGVTPELAGMSDLVDGTDAGNPTTWADALSMAIARALDLEAQPAEVSGQILRRARELESSIYANPEWTRRR